MSSTVQKMLSNQRDIHLCYIFEQCDVSNIQVKKRWRGTKTTGTRPHYSIVRRPGKRSRVISVAYCFHNDVVAYSCASWKCDKTGDAFPKALHRTTARGRLLKRPIVVHLTGFDRLSRNEKKKRIHSFIGELGLCGKREKKV